MFDQVKLGIFILVLHTEDADEEWHEFEVTALTSSGLPVVLTGDEDHYVLERGDVEEVHLRPHHGIPAAVRQHGGPVVKMGTRYTAAQRRKVREEGISLAAAHDAATVALPLVGADGGAKSPRTGAEISVRSYFRPGHSWLLAEPCAGHEVGDVIPPRPSTDVVLGDFALAKVGGLVVKLERVADSDIERYGARQRRVFADWGATGAAVTPRLSAPKNEDIRTLAVDFDRQGERYKEWRVVAAEVKHEETDPMPFEGPPTMTFLCKHMERHGRTPKGWVETFVREKGLTSQDRVVHELRCLAEIMELAGTFDQLNLANLASMEFLGRRIQAIVDAHTVNPQKPNYESSTLFTGVLRAADGIAPELRNYVARRARDEAEVEKQRQKVRELKSGKPDTPKKG